MAFNGTVTNEPLNFGGLGMTGGRRFRLSTLDFAATGYPLAGEPVLASDFNLHVAIEAIMLVGITDGADVVIDAVFDAENSKIILVDIADGLPLAAATDASGVSAKFLVIGY